MVAYHRDGRQSWGVLLAWLLLLASVAYLLGLSYFFYHPPTTFSVAGYSSALVLLCFCDWILPDDLFTLIVVILFGVADLSVRYLFSGGEATARPTRFINPTCCTALLSRLFSKLFPAEFHSAHSLVEHLDLSRALCLTAMTLDLKQKISFHTLELYYLTY